MQGVKRAAEDCLGPIEIRGVARLVPAICVHVLVLSNHVQLLFDHEHVLAAREIVGAKDVFALWKHVLVPSKHVLVFWKHVLVPSMHVRVLLEHDLVPAKVVLVVAKHLPIAPRLLQPAVQPGRLGRGIANVVGS